MSEEQKKLKEQFMRETGCTRHIEAVTAIYQSEYVEWLENKLNISLTAEQKAKVIRLCEIIENNVDRYCSQCDYKKYQAGDNPCGDCEYPLAKQLKEELQG